MVEVCFFGSCLKYLSLLMDNLFALKNYKELLYYYILEIKNLKNDQGMCTSNKAKAILILHCQDNAAKLMIFPLDLTFCLAC